MRGDGDTDERGGPGNRPTESKAQRQRKRVCDRGELGVWGEEDTSPRRFPPPPLQLRKQSTTVPTAAVVIITNTYVVLRARVFTGMNTFNPHHSPK